MMDLSKYKLLVIEDDVDSRQILIEFLNTIGFEPQGVGDGFSAIKKIKLMRPDLIFLDIMMPRLDGFGVLKKLQEENIKVKTIVLTALDKRENVETTLKLGVDDYIVKPYNFDDLTHKIEKVMGIPIFENSDKSRNFKHSIEVENNLIYIKFEGDVTEANLLLVKVELLKSIKSLSSSNPKFILDLRDTNPDSYDLKSLSILFTICYGFGIKYISDMRFVVGDEKIKNLFRADKTGRLTEIVNNKIEGKNAFLGNK